VESVRAAVQQIRLGDRVVVQRVIGDVVLRVHHVLDQLVAVVLRVGGEEDVLVSLVDLAERGDHARDVRVADVVLLAVRRPPVPKIVCGRQDHVGLVDVGAVGPLGQAKREHLALFQLGGRLALGVLVVAHPDRAQASAVTWNGYQ